MAGEEEEHVVERGTADADVVHVDVLLFEPAEDLLEDVDAVGHRSREPGGLLVHLDLSHRELEVLALIVEGHDNAAIAAALIISPHTVKNHVASIFEKLGVANRLQASVQALRRGLIS